MSETLSLNALPHGRTARIVDVDGDDSLAVRLMEMGLTEGEPITLIGKSLLGDPLEYEVRGYNLSLRSTEAQRVRIELLD